MKKLFIITLVPLFLLACKKDKTEKLSDHTLTFTITCLDCTVTLTGGKSSSYRINERVRGSKSVVANMSDVIPFEGMIKAEVSNQNLKLTATEKKGSVTVVNTVVDAVNSEAAYGVVFNNGFIGE